MDTVSDSPWRKTSYSGQGGANCVEVAAKCTVLVRDTKQHHLSDNQRTVVPFSAPAWTEFTTRLKK
jgi:hypothetical protein